MQGHDPSEFRDLEELDADLDTLEQVTRNDGGDSSPTPAEWYRSLCGAIADLPHPVWIEADPLLCHLPSLRLAVSVLGIALLPCGIKLAPTSTQRTLLVMRVVTDLAASRAELVDPAGRMLATWTLWRDGHVLE